MFIAPVAGTLTSSARSAMCAAHKWANGNQINLGAINISCLRHEDHTVPPEPYLNVLTTIELEIISRLASFPPRDESPCEFADMCHSDRYSRSSLHQCPC